MLLCRGQLYLNMASCKQVLHQGPVGTTHSGMMNGKAMGENGLQIEVIAGLCLSLQVQTARPQQLCDVEQGTRDCAMQQ